MVRVRKLVLAIAAASALSSGMAHALGLGEVTLQSALNQPLVAEIELLEVRDLGSDEVLPNLASPDEFTKAGVDRQYFLTDLKFTPILKPNGKSVIRVTSSKPVREPYLNFLVEVLWPSGRLLREYTLLLDPPLYSPQAVTAVAPATSAAAPVVRAPAAPVAPASVPSSSTAAASSAPLGEQYKTSANDTLWEIAQRVRGSGSVNQAMLAIQDLNPQAFIDGNINRLKRGQVLRLPDAQQIARRTREEAIAQVAAQNASWREARGLASARQLDATKRSVAGAAPAEVKAQDSLKLVAADAGKATSGSEKGSADSKALADKLAVTQESLDSTRRENDELKSRMGDLQGQLDKLQRLIQLKDDQLAKLQVDLAAQEQVPVAPAASESAAATTAAPVVVEEATGASETVEQTDFNYSEEVAQKPAATEAAQPPVAEQPAAPVKPAEPAAKAPVAAPAPAVSQPAETSLVDDLLANPMLLGVAGGGALLLVLVGLMMLSRRNALKEAELQEGLVAEATQADFDADMQLQPDSFEGLSTEGDETPASANEGRVTAQTGDALGEADIYIAYGRFNQAAELLQNAINDEPHRGDLRVKLMEVQAELGDREGFARQEAELREIGGAAAQVEQLKAKYPAMVGLAMAGTAAAAVEDDMGGFSLDDLGLDDAPEHAKAGAEDSDDAFDLSLDELESELDRDLPSSAASASEEELDTLSLDDDFELDEVVGQGMSKDDELEFELSLDEGAEDRPAASDELAGFDLMSASEEAPAVSDEDEFLLSLDDEAEEALPGGELAESSFELTDEEVKAAAEDNAFDLPMDFDLSLSEEAPAESTEGSFAAQLEEVSAELDQLSSDLEPATPDLEVDEPEAAAEPALGGMDLEGDDDFDFLAGTDEAATKLDLARAYIDMGDAEGARDILDEVVVEGSEDQQQEARELIAKLV
ncbi:FimV/HubP family polar landmark protein [Pseudomonas zhanjiangensis]|uniref:FimV/HubP family polar landmark protein n=1 Tax=Pseudomonas zhanjiangensis TaxID=3239015 RepID=A0ABV3YYW0_9PSED